MDDILSNLTTNFNWQLQVYQFNQSHAAVQSLVSKYGLDKKTKFVKELICKLKSVCELQDKDEVKKSLLEAVRICCREEDGMDELCKQENTRMVFEMAGYISTQYPQSDEVALEATKLLVNMLVKLPSTKQPFLEASGASSIANKIQGCHYNSPLLFPLCRIIFHLSLDPQVCADFVKYGTVGAMIKILEECVTSSTTTLPEPTVSDALRVIFNLTMWLGPLNGTPTQPSSTQSQELSRLIPIIRKILSVPSEDAYQAKLAVVNCLINVPSGHMKHVFDDATLNQLVNILKVQLMKENTAEGLTSVLMVLTLAATELKEKRPLLRGQILPQNLSTEVTIDGPQETVSIASKLKEHMTSVNVALKHYSSEFIFVLCDEDPTEFSRVVGLGAGAGLLADKKLLSAFSGLAPNRQEPKEANDSDEEAELEELAQKIERLQSLGAIKFVKKDEK